MSKEVSIKSTKSKTYIITGQSRYKDVRDDRSFAAIRLIKLGTVLVESNFGELVQIAATCLVNGYSLDGWLWRSVEKTLCLAFLGYVQNLTKYGRLLLSDAGGSYLGLRILEHRR